MDEERQGGSGGIEPADVREPTPAERVRTLPMVSVALGSLALGFCVVYFVCRPEGADRSSAGRPLAAEAGAPVRPAAVQGESGELRTDVDASTGSPAPSPEPPSGPPAPPAPAAGQPPPPPPPIPVPDAQTAAPPLPESPSVFGSRLTLTRSEIRKCAGTDGVEVPKERCGRVRGIELFMARGEGATRGCIERSFEAAGDRPSVVAVTMDVNFETKTARISIPGADQARAAQYAALRSCLERELGAPDYARIEHPLNSYRFVFAYSYSR